MTYGDTPLELKVHVDWPGGAKPMGHTGPYITSATDDKGTNLITDKHGYYKPDDLKKAHSFGNNSGLDIDLALAEPARGASTYSVAGSIVLHFPGKIEQVKIPKIKQYVGKALPKTMGLTIKLTKLEEDSVTLEISGAGMDKFQKAEALAADGTKLKNSGSSNNSFGKKKSFNYSFRNGTPATLVLHLADEIKQQKVPFDFKNLELP